MTFPRGLPTPAYRLISRARPGCLRSITTLPRQTPLSIDYMMLPDDTDAWMSTTTMTTQPQIQGVLGYYTVLETRISLLKEVVDALPEHDKDWAVDRLDALVAPYVRDIRARVRLLGHPWAE